MQRSADSIYARLDGFDRDLDRMLAWQNRVDGALVHARWALGASLVSLIAVALQVLHGTWFRSKDHERAVLVGGIEDAIEALADARLGLVPPDGDEDDMTDLARATIPEIEIASNSNANPAPIE